MCKVSAVIHGSDRATVARVALRMCNRYGWACATAAPNRLDFVTQQNLSPEETSKRLRLLLDSVTVERGTEPLFPEISRFVAERGISLSRSRWQYLLSGARLVEDQKLFEALSDFFGVEPGYLLGTAGQEEVPEKVAAQLELVRAMRAAKVQSFAARTLGDVSPAALKAITKFLNEEVVRSDAMSSSTGD
jgi:hypothetical protein